MEQLTKQLTAKYAYLQGAFWISQCSIFSFATVFLKSKNFNNVQIGLVFALAAILSIILQPVIAAFADKNKQISLRYIVISLMAAALTLAILLYILPDSFPLIAVTYILINAIQFTLNSLFNSLALEYVNMGIPINYGLARGMGSITFAVTSIFLGFFVDRFGPGILLTFFIFCYCFVILGAFLFKITIPKSPSPYLLRAIETASNKKVKNNTKEDKAPAGIFTFFVKYKKFSILLIGIIFIYYAHNLICTYLINIIEHAGGDSSDMGVALSIAAALELPTMAAFIYIVKKIRCNRLVIISSFFFLVKVIVIWLAPNVLTIHISQAFQMLAFALYTPTAVYYVNSIMEDQDKVKGQAMLGVASTGIAGTIANITGGRILDTMGVSDMLLLGSVVTAAGFLIVCFATERTKIELG